VLLKFFISDFNNLFDSEEVLEEEWHDETFDCDDEEKTKQLREIEEEARLRLDPYPKPLGLDEGRHDKTIETDRYIFETPTEGVAEEGNEEEDDNNNEEYVIDDVDVIDNILEPMDEELHDAHPDLPAIFAKVLDGPNCCADNCLNAFTREVLEKTLGDMAKLTQHARCKMLYSVAAFGLAPDSEKEAAQNPPVPEPLVSMTRAQTAAHNEAKAIAEEKRNAAKKEAAAAKKVAAAAKKKKKEDYARAAAQAALSSHPATAAPHPTTDAASSATAASPPIQVIEHSTAGPCSAGSALFVSPARGRGGRMNERERYASPGTGTPSPANVSVYRA
jgi:hypothetical protein